MTMPAGTYYVGDLCYVLHEEWDECCELFFAGRNDHGCNEGEFTLKDGRKFASFNTAYGDGEYYDQAGRAYSVDSGGIGCILLSDIDLLEPSNFIRGGQVIEFPHDFEVSVDSSYVIYFGSVMIDTNPCEEEDEEDEEYYDDEE